MNCPCGKPVAPRKIKYCRECSRKNDHNYGYGLRAKPKYETVRLQCADGTVKWIFKKGNVSFG